MKHSVAPLRFDPLRFEPTPMCEASVQLINMIGATNYYRERRKKQADANGSTPDKCQRRSTWNIDGQHLCTLHAGRVALSILTEPTPGPAPLEFDVAVTRKASDGAS